MNKTDSKKKNQGEGDYAAAERYNDGATEFAESGKVEAAKRAARPRSASEEQEMAEAEQKGLERSKGEDPAISIGTGKGD